MLVRAYRVCCCFSPGQDNQGCLLLESPYIFLVYFVRFRCQRAYLNFNPTNHSFIVEKGPIIGAYSRFLHQCGSVRGYRPPSRFKSANALCTGPGTLSEKENKLYGGGTQFVASDLVDYQFKSRCSNVERLFCRKRYWSFQLQLSLISI